MADEIIVETTSNEVIEVAVPGPQGATGANGTNGQGVPVGGTTGQVLRKVSGTNYDTEWAAAASGSGSVTSVALAGTGLSISGSPITTSGTITANVSYGTTAGTATQGNDSRISNIRATSINTLSGANVPSGPSGGTGGSINLSGGAGYADEIYGGNGAGAVGGSIELLGGGGGADGNAGAGGIIQMNGAGGNDGAGGRGGRIYANGNVGDGNAGTLTMNGVAENASGDINVSASGNTSGGSIDTSGGGSIITSNEGGSIDTRGTGSIGLGVSGTRTTLTGTATADRAISLPNASGTIALTSDFAAPPAIGNTTRNTGAFTTLSASNDMEITDATKGVILKSPNNTRYRLTVSNSGLPIFTALLLLVLAQLAPAQNIGMATDTNGAILTDRTNVLTFTNRVSLPISSGAATTNSLLTADGAGGSAFVVSRTQAVAMTNSAFRTNTTDSSTNNAQAGMALNLDANSTYHFAYAFITTSSTTGGFGASLRHSNTTNGLRSTYVGRQGRPINVAATDITAISNGVIALQAVNFAGTNIVTTGTGILATGTASGTLTLCWHQNTATNVASELVAGSMMTVTKISP